MNNAKHYDFIAMITAIGPVITAVVAKTTIIITRTTITTTFWRLKNDHQKEGTMVKSSKTAKVTGMRAAILRHTTRPVGSRLAVRHLSFGNSGSQIRIDGRRAKKLKKCSCTVHALVGCWGGRGGKEGGFLRSLSNGSSPRLPSNEHLGS